MTCPAMFHQNFKKMKFIRLCTILLAGLIAFSCSEDPVLKGEGSGEDDDDIIVPPPPPPPGENSQTVALDSLG